MGYCISVCMEKGGVGKTVTVCNLAALMAQDGKRVLVVDMDAQGNCTYTLTGARVTDNTEIQYPIVFLLASAFV